MWENIGQLQDAINPALPTLSSKVYRIDNLSKVIRVWVADSFMIRGGSSISEMGFQIWKIL